MPLQRLDHRQRQQVRTLRFAGMELDRHLAGDILIDLVVNLQQTGGADILRKRVYRNSPVFDFDTKYRAVLRVLFNILWFCRTS